MKKNGLRIFLFFLCLCLASLGTWYYFHGKTNSKSRNHSSSSSQPAQNTKVASVRVATATKGPIKVFLDELGNVTPRSTVTVHSRVEGQLMRILFQEGQMVKAGDLLVELDASPYHAQLMQAQGQLKKDQALLKEAQIKFERYKVLFGQDAIARQELDSQESLVNQYEGATAADEGQIESANVQINYTKITSPISGRVGLRQTDLGNIVHVNDQNGIVTIAELQPITVVFSIPENQIPFILRRMEKKELLLVLALDREEGHTLDIGKLTAIDTQIDTQTGTVKCKAEFANKNLSLFPNQFVNVRVLLENRRNSTLIPASAIQHGSKGAFVFLVKDDDTVTIRLITPGIREGLKASVEAGLQPGDTVVTEGMDALREGTKINVTRDMTDSLTEKKGTAKFLPTEKSQQKNPEPADTQ